MYTTFFIFAAITGAVYYAYRKERIDFSAVASTGAIGLICFVAGGNNWLIPLFIFFVLGTLASSYKRKIKKKFGIGQSIRTWRNVVANGGAAAIFALLYLVFQDGIYFLGLIGAMATALADTLATELGQVYGRSPRLISNLEKVEVGTPGAVSKEGLLFALLGSGIISSLLLVWGYGNAIFIAALISGFIGAFMDSFLGATLETKGYIDTHMVNFVTTVIGGFLAGILGMRL